MINIININQKCSFLTVSKRLVLFYFIQLSLIQNTQSPITNIPSLDLNSQM